MLNHLLEISPQFGILFFIEFIAFFFLRLYRNAMDEFRYFESIQRFREDSLVLFVLSQTESSYPHFEKIIDRYNQPNTHGKILKDETTELLELRKNQKDELAIFEQLAEIVKAVKK